MSKTYDFMLDWETLDEHCTGKVLSVALCYFDVSETNTFDELFDRTLHIKFAINDQPTRTVSKATLKWWSAQSEEAKKVLKPADEDMLLADGVDLMNSYFEEHIGNKKESFLWARGIHFDFPYYIDVLRTAGRESAINVWNLNCSKIWIRDMTGDMKGNYRLDNGIPKEFVAHDARSDVCHEIMKVQEIVKKVYADE